MGIIYNSATAGNFNTAAGPVAAGGSVAGLVDKFGGIAVCDGTKVTLSQSGGGSNNQFFGLVAVPGSDAELTTEQTVTIAANHANGINLGMASRSKPFASGQTRQMYFYAHFARNTQDGYRFVIGAQRANADQYTFVDDRDSTWVDPAKAYGYRFNTTGANPTTLVFQAYEVATGVVAKTVTYTTPTTAGTTDAVGRTIDPAEIAELETVGLCGLIHPVTNGQVAPGPTSYASYTVNSVSAVAPPAPVISLTSRAAGQNVVAVSGLTGGVGPFTYQWYAVSGSVNWTPAGGNAITGATTNTLTDTNGGRTAAGVYTFYRCVVTDSGGRTGTSNWLLVEGLRPALGAVPLQRPGLKNAGVGLLVIGDSISSSPDMKAGVLAALIAEGYINPIVSTVSVPGSSAGKEWRSDSTLQEALDLANPLCIDGVQQGPPTKKLLQHALDRLAALKAANPGRQWFVISALDTNDDQHVYPVSAGQYNTISAIDNILAAFGSEVVASQWGGVNWINTQVVTAPANLDVKIARQAAVIAHANGTTLWPGDTSRLYQSYLHRDDPTWYALNNGVLDQVHLTPAQVQVWGGVLAGVAMRGMLADPNPDTTPPTITAKTLAVNGVTLTLTTSENTTGTAGFTVRVAGVVREAAWVRTNATTLTATLTGAAYLGQAVTLSYNAADGDILDGYGNEVGDFSNAAVNNNSTVPVPVTPSGAVQIVRGPLLMTPTNAGPDGTCVCFTGDLFEQRFTLTDANGVPVSLPSGAVVSVLVTSATGEIISGPTAAVIKYADGGVIGYMLQATDTSTADVRRNLTARLTNGAEVHTFGPVVLAVRRR